MKYLPEVSGNALLGKVFMLALCINEGENLN